MSPLGPGWDHCHPCIHPFRVTTLGFFLAVFTTTWGGQACNVGSLEVFFWHILTCNWPLGPWFWMTSGGNQYGPGPLQRQENTTWWHFCAHHNSNFPAVIVGLNEKHFQDLIGCQISLKFKVVRIECITDSQWEIYLLHDPMSITIHQVRATVRSPPASAMSLKPNDALWAVGVGVGHVPCFNVNGWFRWRAALVLHSTGSFWKSWRFVHVSFFPWYQNGGFSQGICNAFRARTRRCQASLINFFMVFRASTEINTQKKHPPQDTSELRNVFCISTYQFVFVKWMSDNIWMFWDEGCESTTLAIELICFLGLFPEFSDRAQAPSPRVQGAWPRVQIAAKLLWNLGWNHEPG